jgi:peptide/nickel transport system substrate-binding protein
MGTGIEQSGFSRGKSDAGSGPADPFKIFGADISRRSVLRAGGIAGVLAAPLLAAACASSGSSAKGGSGSAKKSLIYLDATVALALDFDGADGADPGTQIAWENIYEQLVYYPLVRKGDEMLPDLTNVQGRLAESWTQDGLEWTFKLRQGVKSPAGNELTADDVIWTVARAKSVSGQDPVTWFLLNAASILGPEPLAPNATAKDKELQGEVVKIDKYTVKFTQFAHNVLFPGVLAVIHLSIFDSTEVKKHATASDPWAHEWLNNSGAAGFGAYGIKSWTKGSSLVLEANPNYYRGAPEFKTINIQSVPEPGSRLAALSGGSADLAGNLTPPEYASLATTGATFTWFGNVTTMLILNYDSEPWSGGGDATKARLLRQAVAYAIPYSSIISSAYAGQAQKLNGQIPPTFVGAVNFPDLYPTDLDKARARLAQAGHANGAGLSGPGLELSYAAENQAILEPVATQIQTSLKSIGINITLKPTPSASLAASIDVSKNVPFALYDHALSLIPDAGYLVQGAYVSLKVAGRSIAPNYSNPVVDRLYLKEKTLSGSARDAVLKQIQDILMDDLPMIPLVINPTQLGARKGITNWVPTMTAGTHFWYLQST